MKTSEDKKMEPEECSDYISGCPGCGSKNIAPTGHGGYQDADASRGLPMIEGELVYCKDCGRS